MSELKELTKELCNKSGCHHKCNDTTDCVVEEEAKEVIANSATTKEKQIEVLKDDICIAADYCYGACDECNLGDLAESLYNAGYRKVVMCKDCKFNVVNMEKDPLDITDYSGDDIVCSYFMTDGLEPTDFCNYGAKMKGGE